MVNDYFLIHGVHAASRRPYDEGSDVSAAILLVKHRSQQVSSHHDSVLK